MPSCGSPDGMGSTVLANGDSHFPILLPVVPVGESPALPIFETRAHFGPPKHTGLTLDDPHVIQEQIDIVSRGRNVSEIQSG